MRPLGILLAIFCSSFLCGQNQTIGIGLGSQTTEGDEWFFCTEGYYSFNYKLLYTKVNYMYNTGPKDDYYKNLQHVGILLGLQSNNEKKVAVFGGLGARFLTAKNYPMNPAFFYIEDQINPFLNMGAQLSLSKNHKLILNTYYSMPHGSDYYGKYNGERFTILDFRVTAGYAYKFVKN